MVDENQRIIIRMSNYEGSHTCDGCGSYTPDGVPTGNPNIKHFALRIGNSSVIITYCNECAAKIARFLLEAWED
jgi:hypothetical protein